MECAGAIRFGALWSMKFDTGALLGSDLLYSFEAILFGGCVDQVCERGEEGEADEGLGFLRGFDLG
jgi:hypothetical protein